MTHVFAFFSMWEERSRGSLRNRDALLTSVCVCVCEREILQGGAHGSDVAVSCRVDSVIGGLFRSVRKVLWLPCPGGFELTRPASSLAPGWTCFTFRTKCARVPALGGRRSLEGHTLFLL